MAILFSQIAPLVVQQLNAAGTYTATPSDPRFYTQGIKDAINEADAFVCGVIASLPGNPWRISLTPTSSSVAHLGVIPAHIGPIVSVIISSKGAKLWDKSEIEFERDNILPLTSIKPHYWIDEDKILFHNGASTATVYYFTFIASTADPPVLQAPDPFAEVVSSKALAFLCDVEGENNSMAEFYDSHWKSSLAALLGSPSGS